MKQVVLKRRALSSEIEEAIRTLRTNIQFCGDDKRVIMITSCLGGEGKSTILLELACSLAALEKNVLLIDADLRKAVPNATPLEKNIRVGLTHYLAGQCDASEAIYQSNQVGVYLMPVGVAPPNPSEMLASDRMKNLIAAARESYDYILIDSAPLGIVVDAAVLAPQCDGAILLIESGTIPGRFARDVKEKLDAAHCPILGAVLNKLDVRTNTYYGYGKNGYYTRRYNEYEE